MIQHLFFVISISTVSLFSLVIFPQPVYSSPQPYFPISSSIRPQLAMTNTIYLPLVLRPAATCDPSVRPLVLQLVDMPGYIVDPGNSGPVDFVPEVQAMGAVAGCETFYDNIGEISASTPMVLSRVILFQEVAGATAYLDYRQQSLLALTSTHQIDIPFFGDERLGFKRSSWLFEAYVVEFRADAFVGSVATPGFIGSTRLADTIKYARIVEAKLLD